MMEHIRQHDWCSARLDDSKFLDEEVMENCVINRILRNKMRNPMVSSDEEEDHANKTKMDWTVVFRRKNDIISRRKVGYVAGCRDLPPYPKLSSLTVQQQFQGLKVICAQDANVLPSLFFGRPMNRDYKELESFKEIYFKEQKEFIEWGKSLWASSHSQRALRPKPATENIYEAEFNMRASSLQSFPKNYEMAAHISLVNKFNRCDMSFKQDLIKVLVNNLPQVDPQEPLLDKFTIFGEYAVPEPCNKHPCWFTLPTESEMSVLPLTEIHRELGQYADAHGARVVASESALKCLAQMDTDWMIPLSVCEIINLDGDKKNVLVLGSEFATRKKSAMTRTYRAFRHLLENALIPENEKTNSKNIENGENPGKSKDKNKKKKSSSLIFPEDDSSDDDGDDDWFSNLIIDEGNEEDDLNVETTGEIKGKVVPKNKQNKLNEASEKPSNKYKRITRSNSKTSESEKTNCFYTCSCKDTKFENPPLRSFRKWELKNRTNNDKFNMIVHCSHKMKGRGNTEVITEPLVEYQIDLGGCAQSDDKMKSLALSLLLRRNNASVWNVRIDCCTGEVVRIDTLGLDDIKKKHTNVIQDVCNVVYETVTQLQSLLPGNYILKHEPAHGDNAFLYATRVRGDGNKLCLDFDNSILAEADEAKTVKTPPVLTDVLLPVHKFRKILPLAFTPYERCVAKEPKKPPARNKAPPVALRWPKKNQKKGKKK